MKALSKLLFLFICIILVFSLTLAISSCGDNGSGGGSSADGNSNNGNDNGKDDNSTTDGNPDGGADNGSYGVCTHTGGIPTCTALAVCSACGETYGALDMTKHTATTFSYSVNSVDSAKHDKKYTCCGSIAETVAHSGGTASCTALASCSFCQTSYGTVALTNHTATTFSYAVNVLDSSKHDKKYTCCGSVAETVAHSGGTASCTALASCSICQTSYGAVDLTNHTASTFSYAVNASDSSKHDKKYTCCGSVAATVSHSGGTATCSVKPVCTDCSTSYGEKLDDHVMELYSMTAQSCTTDAATVYKCKFCDHNQTTTIAEKSGHSITAWSLVSRVKKDNTVCQYEITYAGSCTVCNTAGVTKTEIETLHNYKATITTAATDCITQGVKTYSCTAEGCTSSYDLPYSDSSAHMWINDGDAVNGVQPKKCGVTGCTVTKSVVTVIDNTVDKSSIGTNELQIGDVSITLDTATLSLLSDGSVKLTAEELDTAERNEAVANLTATQQELLGDRPIYDFTMGQGNTVVSNFGSGYVTITVPYTLGANDDPDCIVVWYIPDDGEIETIPAIYSNGTATFKTNHFSAYAISVTTPDEACDTNGHSYINGDTVAPTCELNGYTEMICSRCGDIAFGDIKEALGHLYSSAPAKTAYTCTTDGRLVYSCDRDGCEHKQEFTLPAAHKLDIYVENKPATCQSDGYEIYKCSVCQENVKTVLLKTDYHNVYTYYELVGESCLDGVRSYSRCRDCDYSEYTETYYMHMDKVYDSEEDYSAGETTYVYIGNYIDLTDYGISDPTNGPCISIMNANCLCGEVYSEIYLRDPSGQILPGEYGANAGTITPPYEQSQIFTTNQMGPYTPCYNIKFDVYSVTENCVETWYVDFMLDYNTETQTANTTLSYVIYTAQNHKNTTVTLELKYPNSECHDGVIETTYCNDCEKVVDVYSYTPDENEHYYVTTEVICDLSVYSSKGHSNFVAKRECACGSVTYAVPNVINEIGCYFQLQNTINGDGYTTKVYKCSCGISYALRLEESEWPSDTTVCEKYNYRMIYWQCDDNGENYGGATASKAREIEKRHNYTWDYFTYEKLGDTPCLYEKTTHRACLYCDRAAPVTDSWIQNEFKHEFEYSSTTDIAGNMTDIRTCKHCDSISKTVTDAQGNILYKITSYEQTYDLQREVTTTYGNIALTEIYDITTGNYISWYQTTTLNVYIEEVGCTRVTQTIYSDGRSYISEENICDYDYSSGVSLLGSCTQRDGYIYSCINCGAEKYEYSSYTPMGHYYTSIYDNDNNITGFTCVNCSYYHTCEYSYEYEHSSNDCEYYAMSIELHSSTDSTNLKIGYYNPYMNEEMLGIQATITIKAVVYDSEGTVSNEYTLNVTVNDDMRSMLTVARADIDAAITALELSTDAKYDIVFNAVDSYGTSCTVTLLSVQ